MLYFSIRVGSEKFWRENSNLQIQTCRHFKINLKFGGKKRVEKKSNTLMFVAFYLLIS